MVMALLTNIKGAKASRANVASSGSLSLSILVSTGAILWALSGVNSVFAEDPYEDPTTMGFTAAPDELEGFEQFIGTWDGDRWPFRISIKWGPGKKTVLINEYDNLDGEGFEQLAIGLVGIDPVARTPVFQTFQNRAELMLNGAFELKADGSMVNEFEGRYGKGWEEFEPGEIVTYRVTWVSKDKTRFTWRAQALADGEWRDLYPLTTMTKVQ